MLSGRVLVADDDPVVLEAVSTVLVAEGLVVREARDGAEALAELAEGGIDLVITDVSMPELDGVQLAAMARTAGDRVPILVMTAHTDAWIEKAVSRLQRAALLRKPFTPHDLVKTVGELLARKAPARAEGEAPLVQQSHLFPPSLVPMLRERLGAGHPSLAGVHDLVLTELLNVVFFAGLEREEGKQNPIRVIFSGGSGLATEPLDEDEVTASLFRWSALALRTPRPWSIDALVKLAAADVSPPFFTEVKVRDDRLFITGLARERVNLEGDTSIKVVARRPGDLSIRVGPVHVLDYSRGRVNPVGGNDVLSAGPVRHALERSGSAAGVPVAALRAYINAVRELVVKLHEHGCGGILIVSSEEEAELPGESGYRVACAVSPASIICRLHEAEVEARSQSRAQLARSSSLSEIAHSVAEIGALTALDGATVVTRSLRLAGFGVVMPITGAGEVLEAKDAHASVVRPFDLGMRGTRHRAGVGYARAHPGSVAFVASADGHLGCFYRAPETEHVILWRFRPSDLRRP